MTDSEREQAARKWLSKQTFCCGYPKCDGDLGEEHAKECPLFGKETPDTISLLAAYGAECERIGIGVGEAIGYKVAEKEIASLRERLAAAIRQGSQDHE